MKKILSLLLVLALLMSLAGCGLLDNLVTFPGNSQNTSSFPSASTTEATPPPTTTQTPPPTTEPGEDDFGIKEGEYYYTKEDVALYIHLYGRLPRNYVTKSEAKQQYGSNYKAMKAGMRIGGDTFQNREGLLPKKSGRQYYESDIVAEGGTDRGAYRIVFSNDGLVYYTHNHYASFELLYGEP